MDDAATDPKRLSHLAVAALNAAVDHFHAARTLISEGKMFHSNAQFTLLRSAMENAATAVYMLVSDDRDTRILRALQVAWSDVFDLYGLIDIMRENALRRGQSFAEPKKSKAAWREQLQKVAKDRGMSHDQVSQVAAGLSYQKIIRIAAREAFGFEEGEVAVVCWKVNSGASHGKQWEAILKTDRSTVQATSDPLVSQGRTMPSEDQLRLCVAITKKLIGKGWELLDARRKV